MQYVQDASTLATVVQAAGCATQVAAGAAGAALSALSGGTGSAASPAEKFSVFFSDVVVTSLGASQGPEPFKALMALAIAERDFSTRVKSPALGPWQMGSPLLFDDPANTMTASLTSETLSVELWRASPIVDTFAARAVIPLAQLAAVEGNGAGRVAVDVELLAPPDDYAISTCLGAQRGILGFAARAKITLVRDCPNAIVYAQPLATPPASVPAAPAALPPCSTSSS